MREFSYRALDAAGREVRGAISAGSRGAACEALAGQGLAAYSAEPAPGGESGRDTWGLKRFVSGKTDPEALARGLATMLGAGLPLDRALGLMAETERNAAQRAWIEGLRAEILRGQSLSLALSAAKAETASHVAAVIRAGEASGRLPEVLADLSGTMRRMREARETVRSALVYPTIVLLLACSVMAILFAVLFPALAPLFEASGAPLPLPLVVSRSVGALLEAWWPALGIAALASILVIGRITVQPAFKAWKDGALIKLPAVGPFLVGLELSRTARLLGLELAHGVPLLDALKIAAEATRNSVLAAAFDAIRAEAREGGSLAASFSRQAMFPPIAHQLVAAGEASGTMAASLVDLARILDSEAQRRIDRMLALLAPGLTILVGGLIGLMVWSVMGAVLGVNDIAVQ